MKKIITLVTLLSLMALACIAPSAAMLKPLPSPSPSPLPSSTPGRPACTVTADRSLNLRDAPSVDASVLAWLAPGDVLTLLPDPPAGNWLHVQAGTLKGWINSNYCKGQ